MATTTTTTTHQKNMHLVGELAPRFEDFETVRLESGYERFLCFMAQPTCNRVLFDLVLCFFCVFCMDHFEVFISVHSL